jgi:hypothetical protein
MGETRGRQRERKGWVLLLRAVVTVHASRNVLQKVNQTLGVTAVHSDDQNTRLAGERKKETL